MDKRQNYIGKTGLMVFARSPAHYYAEFLDPERERTPSTPTQLFGTLVHSLILEPDTFEARYAIVPEEMNKRKKEWEIFQNEHVGKTLVSGEDYKRAKGMQAAVYRNKNAAALLKNGVAEKDIFAHDPETGSLIKIRPDYYIRNAGIILDIKTTIDARTEAFQRDVYKFKYHVQDALYRDVADWAGYLVEKFIFIAVEKEPPYGVALYELQPTAIEMGRNTYREPLNRYAECVKNDMWECYPEACTLLSLPAWAK